MKNLYFLVVCFALLIQGCETGYPFAKTQPSNSGTSETGVVSPPEPAFPESTLSQPVIKPTDISTTNPLSILSGGGNGNIIYVSRQRQSVTNYPIFLMSTDGKHSTQKTRGWGTESLPPVWSPDGNMTVTSYGYQIYTGSEQKFLSKIQAKYTQGESLAPVWSPDGKKIAFVRILDEWNSPSIDLNYEIFVIDLENNLLTNLTNSPQIDYSPAWSPKGDKIAFVSTLNGNAEIFSMNTDGSEQTNLTESKGRDNFPRWSPDGEKILFVSDRDEQGEIYIMDADGSQPTNLSNSTGSEYSPAWSPGGDKIVFVSTRDGNPEIYIMTNDGSEQTNISNDMGSDQFPAWSPNGELIAFTSTRDGNAEIYIISADGSELVRLTNDLADDYNPVWVP
jgi:Tol biopolymer transport system component